MMKFYKTEDGALSLGDYDPICLFIEMGKSILLAICFDEEIKGTLERVETIRENLTALYSLKTMSRDFTRNLWQFCPGHYIGGVL